MSAKKDNKDEWRNDPEFWAKVDEKLAESAEDVKSGRVSDADEFFNQMRAKHGLRAHTCK